MASMRKALLVLALLVVMLQMASLPAMDKQQPGGGQTTTTTTATQQQGSVSPPPAANNDGGAANNNVASGGDSLTTTNNQQSNPPANKGVGIVADPVKDQGKGNVGIVANPVKDPSKDNAASKTGNTVIHCSPGVGCSTKEDTSDQKASSAASADAQGNSANGWYGTYWPYGSDPSQGQTSNSDNPGSGELHGCPFDYYYDVKHGICLPSNKDMGFFGMLPGGYGLLLPGPQSPGDYVSYGVDTLGGGLQVLGAGAIAGSEELGDILSNWGDQVGGPFGWGAELLGATISDAGGMAGAILEVGGQVVNDVGDAAGDVIDDVGSAAEDVWDDVTGWL
jgi:hypothetical protein